MKTDVNPTERIRLAQTQLLETLINRENLTAIHLA